MNSITTSIGRLRTSGLSCVLLAAPAAGQTCFESYTPLDPHRGGANLLCADLDRDGHADIVTSAWAGYSGSLRVFLGRGQGAFSAPVEYRQGPPSKVIASADLNGDGYPDLVVPGTSWGYVSVFLNRGDGSFAPRVDLDMGLGDADCVACADFDGDGDIDLAFGNTDWSWLKIFRNNGDGTFVAPVAPISQHGLMDLVATDLDGDGDPDLAAICWPGQVEVFLNLGGGNFASPVAYGVVLDDVRRIASADFDGDGHPDLAVLGDTHPDSVVAVFPNLGGGAFGAATVHSLGARSDATLLTVADLDGDHHPDIVVTGGSSIFVLWNRGAGTFLPLAPQPTAGYPQATDAADLDGDGRLDLAVAGFDGVWAMRNEGGLRFAEPPRIPLGTSQMQVLGADLDRDGDADLAVLDRSEVGDPLGRVRIFRSDAGRVFTATSICTVGRCPAALTAVDLDGDGALDLAVANDGYLFPGPTGSVSVLRNHGDGSFAPEIRTELDTYPTAIASADVDRDGKVDVLLLEMGTGPEYLGKVAVLRNDGHGVLSVPVRYPVGSRPAVLRIADLDGDGAPDIVALDLGQTGLENKVSILMNHGDGTYAPALSLAPGLSTRSIACGDVDGDGDVDLVLCGSHLHVYLNDGAGHFPTLRSADLPHEMIAIQLEDLDGDGTLDIAAQNMWTNTVSVFTNAGGGAFDEAGEYAAGSPLGPLCVADLDGDGAKDIASTGQGGIALLYNCASQATSFCSGDGTAGACPCGNNGASGRGCENSAATGGALLSCSGQASLSNDSLRLTSTGELPSSPGVLLQGTLRVAPVAFGDGLRCIGGSLRRLCVGQAVGGVWTVPQPGEASISARSAALGDTIQAGSTRLYQVCYRDGDPAFCAAPQGGSWNVSSGLALRWVQ